MVPASLWKLFPVESLLHVMKQILLLLYLLAHIPVSAQKTEKVFEKVETEAVTDLKTWTHHIRLNTQLPDSVLYTIPGGTYRVVVAFIVDIHGQMGQYRLLTDPGFGLGQVALEAVKRYKGQWKPANQCGRNVRAYKKETIPFFVPAH
jgi:protein TonB